MSRIDGTARNSAGAGAQCIESLERRVLFDALGTDQLDPSFGSGGIAGASFDHLAYPSKIAAQSDGKVVAVGLVYSDQGLQYLMIVRFNHGGSLDGSFGSGGRVITPLPFLTDTIVGAGVTSDNHVVVVAHGILNTGPHKDQDQTQILRLTSAGVLDFKFGHHGIAALRPNGPTAVTAQVTTDGNVIIGSEYSFKLSPAQRSQAIFIPNPSGTGSGIQVARYKANGRLDRTFADRGTIKIRQNDRYDLTGLQQGLGNSILLTTRTFVGAGGIPEQAVVRLTPGGHLGKSFGHNGTVFTTSSAIEPAMDSPVGVIVSSGGAIEELTADGTLDLQFGTGGIATIPFAQAGSIATYVSPDDGEIIVVSSDSTKTVLQRVESNGAFDSSTTNPPTGTIYGIAVTSDRTYVLEGLQNTGSGLPSWGVVAFKGPVLVTPG